MINVFDLPGRLSALLLADLLPDAEPAPGEEDGAQVVPLEQSQVAPARGSAMPGRKAGGPAPLEVSRRFAPDSAAVPDARATLEPLATVVDPATFNNLRLLVSELVTNSVRHGSPQSSARAIELSVVAAPRRVRAEIADSGPGFTPAARSEGDDQGSGWGLHLVEHLSDCWGIERNGRTLVWFEMEAEFEPEWWLGDQIPQDASAYPRSRAFSGRGEWPTAALRRLGSIPTVLRQQEPEPDVD